jgi:hypothetical protein
MKGKREALWAVVVSATLITAGLILGCGDDAPTCQDACKKLVEECNITAMDGWNTVEECVEACETPNEEWEEAEIRCIVDVSCDDLGQVCIMCGWACEIVINECELTDLPGGVEDLDTCYEDCKKKEEGVIFNQAECIIEGMYEGAGCGDVLACFK